MRSPVRRCSYAACYSAPVARKRDEKRFENRCEEIGTTIPFLKPKALLLQSATAYQPQAGKVLYRGAVGLVQRQSRWMRPPRQDQNQRPDWNGQAAPYHNAQEDASPLLCFPVMRRFKRKPTAAVMAVGLIYQHGTPL